MFGWNKSFRPDRAVVFSRERGYNREDVGFLFTCLALTFGGGEMLPIYLGVFLLSMAGLAFEITLTRVFSLAQTAA